MAGFMPIHGSIIPHLSINIPTIKHINTSGKCKQNEYQDEGGFCIPCTKAKDFQSISNCEEYTCQSGSKPKCYSCKKNYYVETKTGACVKLTFPNPFALPK